MDQRVERMHERQRQSQRLPGLWAMRSWFAIAGRLMPSLAADTGERLFTTPPRWPPPERERTVLSEGKRIAIPFGLRALTAWSWGEGPPVLLVHGWGGRAGQMTPFVPALIEHGFSAIAFDGPAHGESPGERTSLPEFAHAVAAAIRMTGPPAAIVGHSMGAAASVLALRDGVDPRGLVLIAPPARPVDYLQQFAALLWIPERALRILGARVEERYGIQWKDLDLPRVVREFSHPMLLVHDEEDRDALWTQGRELAEAWPGSEMMTTRGLGHTRILRDEEVVDRVASWVTALPR